LNDNLLRGLLTIVHRGLLVTLWWTISTTISALLVGLRGLRRVASLIVAALIVATLLIVTLIRHGAYICREIVTENEVSGGVGWVCGADPDETEAAVDE